MKGLTNKQREILGWIISYTQKNNYPPSIREVSDQFNVSYAGAYRHLESLIKKGYLQPPNKKRRSMIPSVMKQENIQIPVVGKVPAGPPTIAVENWEDTLIISKSLVSGSRENVFALRVKGDSMIDAGIRDGDIVLVDPNFSYIDGKISVVILEDGEATVKRINKKGKNIILNPANPKYSPVTLDASRVKIVGRVVGLYRKNID